MLSNFQKYIATVRVLVADIAAKSIPIPESLAEMTGTIGEETYQMQSWAWENEDFSYLRLTHLSSLKRVEMFNFAIYPSHFYESPIFASDFVIVGNSLRVAIIDAMPLFPDVIAYENAYVHPFTDLYEKSLSLGTSYERNLDWSFHFMGKNACIRQNVPLDDLDTLHALWKDYLELYLNLAKNASKVDENSKTEIVAWHQRYNQEHLEVERKRNPLMHYFGKELGTKYLEDFLFRTV